MFQENPALREADVTVWDWLATNYSITAALAVRRQSDYSDRKPVTSLCTLLTEIARNPRLFTREWFVRPYTRGRPPMARADFRQRGERDFDAYASPGARWISSRKVREDLRQLRRTEARLRHFVNKRVAHRARRGYRGPATFADLDGALDELGRLLAKYWFLLNRGAAMIQIEPVIQGDYQAVYRVPWKA